MFASIVRLAAQRSRLFLRRKGCHPCTQVASFRTSATTETSHWSPEAQYALYKEPRVKIWRPFLFTVSVSVGSFGLAEYYNRNKLRIRGWWRSVTRPYSSGTRIPVRYYKEPENLFEAIVYGVRQTFSNPSTGQIVTGSILAIQAGIFGLWKLLGANSLFMVKHFLHSAHSGRSYTLLTSAFSHSGFFHILFNSVAFWSFAPICHNNLQTEYFVATIFTSAAVSSFAQHLWSIVGPKMPGLGASGYVLALVTFFACSYPHAKVLVFGIPMSAETMLPFIIGFDVLGLLGLFAAFGITLGHAAHLGGVATGYTIWWLSQPQNRRKLRRSLPSELVALYDKAYRKLFLR